MKAVSFHGRRDVRVDNVPDPTIEEPTDAIVRMTTTNLCGSDLHLYEVLGPFIRPGMILGHEPMGIVEEVGPSVTNLKPGDRVVIPFQVSCGSCFMCDQGLQTQCETTQTREEDMGAMLFGYTKLYGDKDGAQAEFLRVPQAQYTHIKVPEGPPDERFVYLSDVLPTAWQAVEYAGVPDGGSVDRARPRPDRRHGLRASRRTRATASSASTSSTERLQRVSRARHRGRRPARGRRPRRPHPRDDRRPRDRLRHRRGRHGGARLARAPASRTGWSACSPTSSARRS